MDEESETYQLGLYVPGILRLLGEHLYSDPQVALRELIQNASDSCLRRQLEDTLAGAEYRPRIEVMIQRDKGTLVIRDNGAGLTEEEIHQYLSTIGRGYTGELRERLAFGRRDEALSLIGQFGLGMLAAFLVAEQMTIITRSCKPGSIPLRWESTGDASYSVTHARRREPGSTVTLKLKTGGEFLLNEGQVLDAIRRYADFLQIPIYLNGSHTPANVMKMPWEKNEGPAATTEYLAGRYDIHDVLLVVPLHDHVEEVHLPDGSIDSIVTPLRGVLYIPAASVLSIGEYGDTTVYIRRMFVTDEERGLLPRWARFVRGLIDSSVLNPTASREQVRRDEAFYAVQRAVEVQLLQAVQELAAHSPAAWRSIVAAHRDLIKGWALDCHAFFEVVCDLVTFETTRGHLTLPEILSLTDGDIYYTTEAVVGWQEKLLYEVRGLVVVNAAYFAETAFLKAYADTRSGIRLHQLEPGASPPFEPVDETDWLPILHYYTEQGINARIVDLNPAELPAIFAYPPGARHSADIRELLSDQRVSPAVGQMLEEYLRLHSGRQAAAGVLYLNAGNPVLRRLQHIPPESEPFTAVLEIICLTAQFFSGRSIGYDEARSALGMLSFSLDRLLSG
jgi:molecular chaperone HtpG